MKDAKRVLVVDPNAEERTTTKHTLAQIGFPEPYMAQDSVFAWEVLNHHRVDIVVSELRLQGGNGAEFLTKIRGNANFKHLPFLFSTSVSDSRIAAAVLKAGADEVLKKPVNAEIFKQALKKAFAKRALARKREEDPASLGKIFLQKGDIPKAMVFFQEALRKDPDNIEAYLGMAEIFKLQEKTAQYAECAVIASCLYAGKGDIERAGAVHKNLLEVDASAVNPFEDIGNNHMANGCFSEAAEAYKNALILNPDDPRILYRLSKAYQRDGNEAEALKNILLTLEQKDDFSQARRMFRGLTGEAWSEEAKKRAQSSMDAEGKVSFWAPDLLVEIKKARYAVTAFDTSGVSFACEEAFVPGSTHELSIVRVRDNDITPEIKGLHALVDSADRKEVACTFQGLSAGTIEDIQDVIDRAKQRNEAREEEEGPAEEKKEISFDLDMLFM